MAWGLRARRSWSFNNRKVPHWNPGTKGFFFKNISLTERSYLVLKLAETTYNWFLKFFLGTNAPESESPHEFVILVGKIVFPNFFQEASFFLFFHISCFSLCWNNRFMNDWLENIIIGISFALPFDFLNMLATQTDRCGITMDWSIGIQMGKYGKWKLLIAQDRIKISVLLKENNRNAYSGNRNEINVNCLWILKFFLRIINLPWN